MTQAKIMIQVFSAVTSIACVGSSGTRKSITLPAPFLRITDSSVPDDAGVAASEAGFMVTVEAAMEAAEDSDRDSLARTFS